MKEDAHKLLKMLLIGTVAFIFGYIMKAWNISMILGLSYVLFYFSVGFTIGTIGKSKNGNN